MPSVIIINLPTHEIEKKLSVKAMLRSRNGCEPRFDVLIKMLNNYNNHPRTNILMSLQTWARSEKMKESQSWCRVGAATRTSLPLVCSCYSDNEVILLTHCHLVFIVSLRQTLAHRCSEGTEAAGQSLCSAAALSTETGGAGREAN